LAITKIRNNSRTAVALYNILHDENANHKGGEE